MRRWMSCFALIVSVCVLSGCVEKQGNDKGLSSGAQIDPIDKPELQKVEGNAADTVENQVLSQLPSPPDGFTWSLFKGVAFLRPASWHTYSQGNTYCSSVESIPENGFFETGLTVQIVKDSQKNTGFPPLRVAVSMIDKLKKQPENTELLMRPNEHENIYTLVFRYRNAPAKMPPIIVHKYFQISKERDFINIVTFETTEKQWSTLWKKYGEVALGTVAVYGYE